MHGLEIGSKGQVAFATRAEPAWHNLGTVFDGDLTVTTREMLNLAHLSGWDVRLNPVPTEARDTREYFEVLRTNPFDGLADRLAIVGERYKVIQNEGLFDFGDEILAGGGQWESAGSIKDGRVVFGSLKIDRSVVLDPSGAADTTNLYLLVNTSHDGSVSVQASITPVRVVCQNTLNFALSGVKQSFKMRHTQTVHGKMLAAREALGLTFQYADAFQAEAEALFAASVTKDKFDKIIKAVYPEPEKDVKGALKRWENKRDTLMGIFTGSNQDAPDTSIGVAGTGWGALNALTERIDWYRSPRGGNVNNLFAAASGFDPVVNAEKNKIKAAVKALVLA